MPASTCTLTGDLSSLAVGVNLQRRLVRARLESNTDGLPIIDGSSDGSVHFGALPLVLDASGAFSQAGIIRSDASTINIASGTLQYQVVVDYDDPATGQRLPSWESGWFTLTAATADLRDVAGNDIDVPLEWRSFFRAEMEGLRDAAADSAANSDTSADLAAASESAAATSAATATTKAGEAATSATNAAASETAAAASETNAAASEAAAATSETNAAASETAAEGYAASAAGSVSLVAWAPTTAYAAGDVRQAPDGSTIRRLANGTSGATFDATEEAAWEAVLGNGTTIDGKALSASYGDQLKTDGTPANLALKKFEPVTLQVSASVNDMIMVGSYAALNIVPDAASKFTTDITGWTAVSGCSVSWESTIGHNTAGSLKVTHDSGVGTTSVVRSPAYAITELLNYASKFHSRPGTTQRNVTPLIEWLDSGGTIIGTTVIPLQAERNGTWQPVTAAGVAPTGATQFRLNITWANNGAGEVHYLDDFEVRLGADRIYAQHCASSSVILYNDVTSAPGLDGWKPLPALPAPQQIYKVVQALNGDLVALSKNSSTIKLYHLTLGATSWTEAQVIGTGVSGLYRSMAVDPVSGEIFYAEYADPGVTTFNVWSSTDNGVTWAKVETFTGFAGHIHAIKIDPYVPGRVWLCMGDNDAVANIRYTDNIHAGIGSITWTVIDSGTQRARTVDLMFTEQYVLWAADTPDITLTNFNRWDRTTHDFVILADDMRLTAFYAALVGDKWAVIDGLRTDIDGSQQMRTWGGHIDQYGRAAAMSYRPISGAVRLDGYIDGPDSSGNLFICYVSRGVSLNTAVLHRGHLLDGTPGEVRPAQMVDRQLVAQPSYHRVGAFPGTDDGATTVAGRMWMWSFTADQDMLVASVIAKIGSAVGTSPTLQWVLLEPDAKDFWKTILGLTTADTPVVNSTQTFTFDTKVFLRRGKRYALGVVSNVAGTKLRGGNAGINSALHSRSISSMTLPLTRSSVIGDTKQSIDVSVTALLSST